MNSALLTFILIFSFSCNWSKNTFPDHKSWTEWAKTRAFSTAHYGSTLCQFWNDKEKTLYLKKDLERCSFQTDVSTKPSLGKLFFYRDSITWQAKNGKKRLLLDSSNLFDLRTKENGPSFLKIGKIPIGKDNFLSSELWKNKNTKYSYFASLHETKKFQKLEQQLSQLELSYFKYNPLLKVEAQFIKSDPKKITLQKRKKGTTSSYKKGTMWFKINGQKHSLTVYSDNNGDTEKYLMFKDLTSGTSSFGGGRYLKTPDLKQPSIKLDFNYSKNPLCAYSKAWNCTIPDDSIPIEIQAGEKIPKV